MCGYVAVGLYPNNGRWRLVLHLRLDGRLAPLGVLGAAVLRLEDGELGTSAAGVQGRRADVFVVLVVADDREVLAQRHLLDLVADVVAEGAGPFAQEPLEPGHHLALDRRLQLGFVPGSAILGRRDPPGSPGLRETASAISSGVGTIVTRDPKGFPGSPIEILSPHQLFVKL